MTFMDKQVAIPQEVTESIHWWPACCEEWNGRALFIDPNWTQASKVSLWTDAWALVLALSSETSGAAALGLRKRKGTP